MTKEADSAPALAGVAQNPHFSARDRLAAAKQALDFYIDQADKLQELVEYCERQRTGNPNADQAITWAHAGALVQKILNGETVEEFARLRNALKGDN